MGTRRPVTTYTQPEYHCHKRPRTRNRPKSRKNSWSPRVSKGDAQSSGWCPPCVRTMARHSRNTAGTCTSNDLAHQPSYNARPAGVPVVRAVSWDGARQSEGWSPCDWYPPVPSGTTTRPPPRARSQRGVKAPPGADPWPPEPPQSCCTLGKDTSKATLQHVVAGKLNGQSNVRPCVFAGSVVSDTLQRLWPGAHWTVAAQGPKGRCLMYVVEQAADPTVGALEYFNASMAMYSTKTRTNTNTNTNTQSVTKPSRRAKRNCPPGRREKGLGEEANSSTRGTCLLTVLKNRF